MNNDFKFNASDVVCNGNVAGCARVLTEENNAILKTFLNNHFAFTPKEIILKELEDDGIMQDPWIIGRRAGSTDEIIDRMVSGLLQYAYSKFSDYDGYRQLAEMWINAQIKMMTAKDFIIIMESVLMDCASADHWYTYEKQW